MSNLTMFLKKNKVQKENTTYAATTSLCDDKEKPLEWVIKPLTTSETEAIREECTMEIPIPGKPNMFRQKMKTGKYLAKMVVASVVEPNLNNAELQDSYGVKNPEELLQQMVDDPGEYNAFVMFIQEFNNMNNTMQDKVEEAKN